MTGSFVGTSFFDENPIQQGVSYKIVQHLFFFVQFGVHPLLIEIERQYSERLLFGQIVQELLAGFGQLIDSVKHTWMALALSR